MEKEKAAKGISAEEKQEKRYYFQSGGYMIKMPDGYYQAFFSDGSPMTGVTLPINICLMAIRGQLPAAVRICPSEHDVEIEPSLKPLRDNYLG